MQTMLRQVIESFSAQLVTRLLIISYFVAVALGLIPGIEVARLGAPFLPETYSLYLMSSIVLVLSAMVLFGIFRRPAALVLALIVFWASYITLYSGGEIGAFWRDLALIGGLLLTANITTYADRALAEDWDEEEDEVDSILGREATHSGLLKFEDDAAFRDDFDIARVN